MEVSEYKIINTIRDKLRQDELVKFIYQVYQLSGLEKLDRLIAIVQKESNSTYALFSFSVSNWPPNGITDLTIDTTFPINNKFKMEKELGNNSFTISSINGQSTFYYSVVDGRKYDTFETVIKKSLQSIEMSATTTTTPTTFIDNTTDKNFNWLDMYNSPENLSAIDIDIAHGKTKLKERDIKFREELVKRASEYTVNKPYRIYIATWNVNDQLPYDVSLHDWLCVGKESPDIYAIAFQELDMSPKAITFNETRPDLNWINKVKEALDQDDEYEELTTVRLVGMMLILMMKKSIRKSDIQYSTTSVGTGALNRMGNKGGVGISLVINKTYICFVNSHLAAHTHEVEQRKEDHDEIIRRMQFINGIKRLYIEDHHHIFWFGDLNYRIDAKTDYIKDLIERNDYDKLIEYDQLYNQKRHGAVFQGFTEGKIMFSPTYKYNPGTDEFDSSEKARAPAWCDRVLWKGEHINLIEYNNVMDIRLSDHKPVYAIFTVNIPSIDADKMKKVNEELLKTMDKYENDNQPQITVLETDINFEIIRFNERYTRELVVANNHHLPVDFNFRFKDKRGNEPERICENWIKVRHTKGRLYTGQTMTIQLEIFVDSKSAAELNKLQKRSNSKIPLDILVLHIENGRDTFISILAEYKPSCFGFSMETLITLDRPIADVDIKELLDIQSYTDSKTLREKPKKLRTPREVYFLVDYLYKNGLTTPHLFTIDRKYSKNPIINEIRDWLDNWSTDDFPGTPHTTAEALLMLIEGTPAALLYLKEKEFIDNCNNIELCITLLSSIQTVKRTVFLYICLFLRELRKNYQINRLNDDILASIFGKIFFSDTDRTKRCIEGRKIFLLNILTHNSIDHYARTELMK